MVPFVTFATSDKNNLTSQLKVRLTKEFRLE